jgi:hypothetical protein
VVKVLAHLVNTCRQQFVFYVDMLKLERHDGAVARTRENGEGNKRAVAPLDFCRRWHGIKNSSNLLECREWLAAMRRRDARQIFRRIEIFRIRVF